ncbi:RAD50 [Carpediemonas membranifera]|uniref:RAD50 n=1 Tax=Carpediemonas membranifera TaxID=201153 RepID=A0A8J6AX95_9EUKA|nr:RAD50 [Carpediemonas membranifera]|eukprot:KAG9389554.1 RAD50 [Carpediemonas membranifera]
MGGPKSIRKKKGGLHSKRAIDLDEWKKQLEELIEVGEVYEALAPYLQMSQQPILTENSSEIDSLINILEEKTAELQRLERPLPESDSEEETLAADIAKAQTELAELQKQAQSQQAIPHATPSLVPTPGRASVSGQAMFTMDDMAMMMATVLQNSQTVPRQEGRYDDSYSRGSERRRHRQRR